MIRILSSLLGILLTNVVAIGITLAEDEPSWISQKPYERNGFYYSVGTSDWHSDGDTATNEAIERASTAALLTFGEVEIEVNTSKTVKSLFSDDEEDYEDLNEHRAQSRIMSRILKRAEVSQYTHTDPSMFSNNKHKKSVLIKIDKQDMVSKRFEEDSEALFQAIRLGHREREEFKLQIEREAQHKIQEK